MLPMRALFAFYCVTVTVAGVQLFVFSGRTADFFAWTINPPATAAFLGASYWASLPLVFLGARSQRWSETRIAFFGVLVFSLFTLFATVYHRDRFHFDDPHWQAKTAAWTWLAVYLAVPAWSAIALAAQVRAGRWPGRGNGAVPPPLVLLLAAQGAILLALGLALTLQPEQLSRLWPWALTPLTARAVGPWLIGIGLHAAFALYERDRARVRPALLAYLPFSVLQAVLLIRFRETVEWHEPGAWLAVAFLVSTFTAGVFGIRRSWWPSSATPGRN
ncbi:hypothetical protein AYO38_07850 [bacterium SCGC AG-212-C10]|nr:hypothetical protein AYO38_07850 [bacterium SCGC AG-212-C10]